MKIISLNGSPSLKNTCAAIGIFDGVHRGHQFLIRKMLSAARRLKAQPIVITFFPHPAHVIRPDVKLEYLTSLEERFQLLNKLGVAACIVLRFDRKFARIPPEKFIKDILVKKLGVKAVYVGHDFRFGKDRRGDIALFEQLARESGYEIHAVAGFKAGGEVISSSRIRKLIIDGQIKSAAKLLGRPVSVSGKIVKGSKRGKNLGYPTANVDYGSIIIPPQGVYIVSVLVGAKKYPAIANIGMRPTFKERSPKLLLEVHILDFSRNIYGKEMRVEFLQKVRNEMKFEGLKDLVQQIKKDEALARRYFSRRSI